MDDPDKTPVSPAYIRDVLTRLSPIERRLSLHRALHTEPGQVILACLRLYCHYGQTAFVPGDPHSTSFRTGVQNVAAYLVETADLTDDDLARLREQAESKPGPFADPLSALNPDTARRPRGPQSIPADSGFSLFTSSTSTQPSSLETPQ